VVPEKLRELCRHGAGAEGGGHKHGAVHRGAGIARVSRLQRHEEFVYLQFDGFSPRPLATYVDRLAQARSTSHTVGGAA
jgi:hypothetical protein